VGREEGRGNVVMVLGKKEVGEKENIRRE